jgi:urease accessory protein
LTDDLEFLRLLHLADSALPIGALAHSFGLETLVAAELVKTGDLSDFFSGYLQEGGMLDALACRNAFALVSSDEGHLAVRAWLELNDLISARKPGRESRAASAALGRNFLSAVISAGDYPVLVEARDAARRSGTLVHHAAAFGLTSAVLGIDENRATLALVHQVLASLISACQRLMPLGQTEALRILWNLKRPISELAQASRGLNLSEASCFMPLLEWGAMEHPYLTTRLFIS